MVAAEAAHNPMPKSAIIIIWNDGIFGVANNIPTMAVISIIETTLGFVNSK